MAKIDFSKYSDEELERIAGMNKAVPSQEKKQNINIEEMLKFNPQFNAIGKIPEGFARGAIQGIGDTGASIANAPISIAEHLSGHKLPHVPHPNLLNENPSSVGESAAQTLGNFAGGLVGPGGVALKGVQLAGKGYKALNAGKELPLIAKMLAGSAGGAAEGALGNESNRMLGAELGGALGGLGQAAISALNFAKGIKSKNIAKSITDEMNRLKGHFGEVFSSHLHAGEEAGANDFLRPQAINQSLFKKAGKTKQLHALEQYNMNPTLSGAHEAQSDLNKLISKYKFKQDEKIDRDLYKEAIKAKNRLRQQISEAFEKSGTKQHGAGYEQARQDYKNYMAPYLNSPAIQGLHGTKTYGNPTIRPGKFADKLLGEENFLAGVGQNHPELLAREKYNKLKGSKLAHAVALGTAGGAAAQFLPYQIRKILGL